jgi:hypothetical protein
MQENDERIGNIIGFTSEENKHGIPHKYTNHN